MSDRGTCTSAHLLVLVKTCGVTMVKIEKKWIRLSSFYIIICTRYLWFLEFLCVCFKLSWEKNRSVYSFIFQSLINKQWVGFDGQHKLEIRSTLNRFLLEHHNRVPTYIRNKLVKLVVDIGRIDWPHFYPDFFSSILQVHTEMMLCWLFCLRQKNPTIVVNILMTKIGVPVHILFCSSHEWYFM